MKREVKRGSEKRKKEKKQKTCFPKKIDQKRLENFWEKRFLNDDRTIRLQIHSIGFTPSGSLHQVHSIAHIYFYNLLLHNSSTSLSLSWPVLLHRQTLVRPARRRKPAYLRKSFTSCSFFFFASQVVGDIFWFMLKYTNSSCTNILLLLDFVSCFFFLSILRKQPTCNFRRRKKNTVWERGWVDHRCVGWND